jgi:hypothetical protein
MNADFSFRFYLRLSAFICGLLLFSAQAQDAREIITRAFAANEKSNDALANYAFVQRQHFRMLDGKGKVKEERSRTLEVMVVDGSPYRRLVARNDKPLSPNEQKKEDERLRRSDEERRKDTPEQRKARLDDWRRQQKEKNSQYNEVPDAFDFKLAGEETVGETPCYIVNATPKPGYKFKNPKSSIVSKFKGRLWIAKADYGLVKFDAEALDTVPLRGILFRLAKGSRIVVEYEKVNNEAWFPQLATIQVAGRALLLIGIHADGDYTFRDYKKFQVDSRVVSTGEKH